MLLLCDFDGTITTTDVTDLLWDRFGTPGWRDRLLGPYRRGETTILEVMDTGWGEVAESEAELLAYARPRVALRSGFENLLSVCRQRGWTFHVVSCGLDWYLKALLTADVPFVSFEATRDARWRVTLPRGCVLVDGTDFKVHAMRRLQALHPGQHTIFIGDGRNDLPAARAANRRFAVRGSTLARLCTRQGLECEQFDTFDDVIARLS
ncbi:MAG: HAD-IB family phosphatase [Vicinamibacterales bacterium]